MNKYRTGAHTKHKITYHIVWIPKYRKRILTGAVGERVKELIQECADVNRWYIHEINIQPNHVYLLIQLKPDISISKAVQLMKGKSSRIIRKEFPSLEEFLWGDSFWGDGYFVKSIGTVNFKTIRVYVKNQ